MFGISKPKMYHLLQTFLEMFWSIPAMLSIPGLFQTFLSIRSIRQTHTNALCQEILWLIRLKRKPIHHGSLLCSPKPCRAPLETWLWIQRLDLVGQWLPSGKLTWLWKITIFNGKIHYKWSFYVIFNSYVKLPEGISDLQSQISSKSHTRSRRCDADVTRCVGS